MQRRKFLKSAGAGIAAGAALAPSVASAQGKTHRWKLQSANPSGTPHMTLLYDRKTVLPEKLDRPVSWSVREFLLIHSVYGKSEHNVVGRWPLLA